MRNNKSTEYLVRILDFVQASFKNQLSPFFGIFLDWTNVPDITYLVTVNNVLK